jgi:predicted RNase H-like HicB family nuclease
MKVQIIKEDKWYSASIPELGVFAEGDNWEDMMKNLSSGMELTDGYWAKKQSPLTKKEFELVF